MLRVVLFAVVAAVLSSGGASVLRPPVEAEAEETVVSGRGALPYPGKVCDSYFLKKCEKEDEWYLNEERRCSTEERTYIIEPLEQACEAVWVYMTKTAKCDFQQSQRIFTLMTMQEGCLLSKEDKDGNRQFVLSDETAVKMLNVMRENGCKHDQGPTLLIDDVRGKLLNHASGDGCESMVEVEKDDTSERLSMLDTAQRDSEWSACGASDACSAMKTLKLKRPNGDSCRVCCSKSCLYGPPEFRRMCCTVSRERSTCACTRNNVPSACGC